MGDTTTTTCDTCGRDITAEPQVRVLLASSYPVVGAEGETPQQSVEGVYCEEHGAALLTNLEALVAP